jgi:hypothetical protein
MAVCCRQPCLAASCMYRMECARKSCGTRTAAASLDGLDCTPAEHTHRALRGGAWLAGRTVSRRQRRQQCAQVWRGEAHWAVGVCCQVLPGGALAVCGEHSPGVPLGSHRGLGTGLAAAGLQVWSAPSSKISAAGLVMQVAPAVMSWATASGLCSQEVCSAPVTAEQLAFHSLFWPT